MNPVVRLDGVSHVFAGGATAVDDLDLEVMPGRFTALLGPSGCGKTTILRIVAGYLTPSGGRVYLNGADATRLPPEKRNIGMVFQSYALFPHMSVDKNVAFGLRARGLPRHEVRHRVREVLGLVGLDDLAGRRPGELSGGQQQRVALARAIAIRPAVLLLDEPLSNLDVRLAVQMRRELARIQRETGLTAILVTHNQEEAMELADEIVVLESGRIVQRGSPEAVFRTPATRSVAEFLGYENILDIPGKGLVAVRPDHVGILPPGAEAPPDTYVRTGLVVDIRFRGTEYMITVDAGGQPITAAGTRDMVAPGATVQVVVPLPWAVGVGTERTDGPAPHVEERTR
jgi:ABC-type Fe3+/spermidine/putrescine transport system ATPase subunit